MTDEDLRKKVVALREFEEMARQPAWEKTLLAELRSRMESQAKLSRDLTRSHAERDGAAGAANELEAVLEYLVRLPKSLSETVAAEEKRRETKKAPPARLPYPRR